MAHAEGGVRVAATISKAEHQGLERLAREHDVKLRGSFEGAYGCRIDEAEGGPQLPLDLG